MKAKSALFLAILFFACSLFGCAARVPAVSGAGADAAGDQSAFLQDMADGIAARLKISGADEESMTDDEFVAYRTKVVNCELDEIGKYTDLRFADERFDELSHAYLDACRMQLSALNYYKNEALYDALWNGGYTARAGLIVYLYEQYDLPITSEQVESYRPSGSASATYSIDYSQSSSGSSGESPDGKFDPTDLTLEYGFLDHTMFSEYWNDGTYRCGTDFKPGEYYILALNSGFWYYPPADNPDSLELSDYVVASRFSVRNGQYVEVDNGALLVHANEVNMKKPNQYGFFKVGEDLPAGEYKIESLSSEYNTKISQVWGIIGAYQVFSNEPFGAWVESDHLNVNQEYLTLYDGQYIAIVNARLTLVA